MVKLRLMRMGKKKQPFYRIVAADSRSPRNGRFIEIVGTYDPRREPSAIELDNAKAIAWLRKGAQPTERVEKILKISGAWDDFKGLPAGSSVTAAPAAKVEAAPAPVPAPAPAAVAVAEAPAEAPPVAEAPAEAPAEESAPAEVAAVEEAAPVEAAPAIDDAAAEAPTEETTE